MAIAKQSRERSPARLLPSIRKAFGVRMATDYLAFSVAFHEADAERVLSHGAKAPLLETADIRNHYALVFALVAFLREHKLRAGCTWSSPSCFAE